jgi:hypothetical protein
MMNVQSLYDKIVKYYPVNESKTNKEGQVRIEIDSLSPWGFRHFVDVKQVLIGHAPDKRHIIIRPERGLFFTEELKSDFNKLKKIEEQAITIEGLNRHIERLNNLLK